MSFCGQCGLKIPSGITQCPRCGTAVDTVNTNVATFDDLNADGATIASLPYPMPTPQQGGFPQAGPPSTPGNPQRFVLHSGDNNIAGPNAPTSRVNAQPYGTYPGQPISGASYPGYNPQGGVHYPAQGASYPDYTPNTVYPIPPQPYEPQQQRSRGRIVSLIVILLGLLILLGALTFFAYVRLGVGRGIIPGGTTTTPGVVTTPSTPAVPPEQQAQAVVTQYYDDVNNKNYEGAYNLWQTSTKPSPTLADFIKGYQNTLRDDLSITQTTQLNDGTVQVFVTLVATEQTSGGSTQSTYKGYYIVGQQGGTWKIQSGQLSKV